MHSMKPISFFSTRRYTIGFYLSVWPKYASKLTSLFFSNRYIQVLRMDKERCIVLHPPCRKMAIDRNKSENTERHTGFTYFGIGD